MQHKYVIHIYLLALLILYLHSTPPALYGQADIIPTKHFNRDNGLLTKKLYTICSDKDGFIWLGGDNGAFRFDGRIFYHYTTEDGLCDNEIIASFADSKGRIWLAGFNGRISVIDHGVIDKQSHFIKHWPHTEVIRDFAEDRQGNIYLVSENADLFKITPGGEIIIWAIPGAVGSPRRLMIHDDKLLMSDEGRRLFTLDPQHDTIWPAPENKQKEKGVGIQVSREEDAAWKIEGKEERFEKLFTTEKMYLQMHLNGHSVLYLSQVKENKLLLSISDFGVFFCDLKNHRCRRIKLPNDTYVPELVADNQNNLWMITSDHGLYAFKLGYDTAISEPLPGFAGNILNAYEFDGELIALTEENTLIVADEKGSTKKIRLKGKKNMMNVPYFFEKNDSLYITGAMGTVIYKKRKIYNGRAGGSKQTLVYKDSIKVIRNHGGLYLKKWPGGKIIHDGRTYAMIIQNNTLWYSGISGVYKYDFSSDSVYGTTFRVPNNGRVEYLHSWGKDMQILCTNNSGLWLLKDGKTTLGRLTAANGLLNDDCRELDIYADGWIIRHPLGLSKVDTKKFVIQTVSEWRNLPLSDLNSVTVSGENLLLSSNKGLFQVNIGLLFKELPEKRRVKFLNILSKGKPIYPENIVLEHGNNHLRIDFAIPEYDYPEQVQYTWRINDGNWSKSYNTSLEFADLGPGIYKFQILAQAPGFAPTKISTLTFKVNEPFWRNIFFLVGFIAILLLSVWVVLRVHFNNRLREEHEQAAIRHKLMSYEQRALNAMMNPHFVFNAMASIQGLLHDGDTARTNNYLVKFSRLIRKSLEASQKESSILEDEIERLRLYLQIEKLRLEHNLSFYISVEGNLESGAILIPTMILQTYIENAVIHGIRDGKVNIMLNFGLDENKLWVKIEDDGPGFNTNNIDRQNERFGLSATSKRLELLSKITGKTYRVNIISPVNVEGGTQIMLFFPIERV